MSDVFDMISDAFGKHKGRADYFSEQKKYSDAISEYIEAIDRLIKLDIVDTKDGATSKSESKVSLTLILCDMYKSIATCYERNKQYYEANMFFNKAEKTCRSVRESGIILDRNILEDLDAKELYIKVVKQGIISRNNQSGKQLLAKKSDSEYDSYIRSIKTLPTSFLESPKISESSSINTSYSSDGIGDKILFGFSLFFVVIAVISLFSGRWFDVIVYLLIASYGRIFVMSILGSFIKF